MEVLREIINSDRLKTLFAVPKSMENMDVEGIKTILSLIDVADVTGDDIRAALDCGWKDFEDCVQHQVASHHHARYIITRNVKDYEDSDPQPVTPEAFLEALSE